MSILISFTPFVAFFVLLRQVSPLAGLIAACLISAGISFGMWRRGETVKILEIGGLALFALLVVYTLIFAPAWSVAGVRLVVDSGLFAIIVFSLVIGRPFTLPYARERVAEIYWTHPVFLRTNRIITAVWAASLAVHMAADAAALFLPQVPLWLEIAASIGALGAALWFTSWYPARVRQGNLAGEAVAP